MIVPSAIKSIKADLKFRDASIKRIARLLLLDCSFRLIVNYRIGKSLYESRWMLVRGLSEYYKKRQILKRSCQISFKANLGYGISFAHPLGIVIGEGVVLKNNIKIWQQVTLGSHGKKGEKQEYPIVNDGVKIYAGAKIFGGITIGKNAVIGANAVVFVDVPDNATAVGNPARIILSK
jgi:serine O-acetyltransferase